MFDDDDDDNPFSEENIQRCWKEAERLLKLEYGSRYQEMVEQAGATLDYYHAHPAELTEEDLDLAVRFILECSD